MRRLVAQDDIISALADVNLAFATPADIDEGHALACRLIGPGLAHAAALHMAQAHTGACCFGHREGDELTGVFAFLLLNPAGLASLTSHRFDPCAPAAWALAGRADPPAAYYGWAFAGVTPAARKAVVAGADLLRRSVLQHIPFFCHAATPAGRRAVTEKLGYRPFDGHDGGLYFSPPRPAEQELAA